jgi:hypothetical protein
MGKGGCHPIALGGTDAAARRLRTPPGDGFADFARDPRGFTSTGVGLRS